MSYVTRTLGPKETVRYATGYHWLYWAGGYVLAIPAFFAAVGGYPYFWTDYAFDIAALLLLPFALIILVRAYAAEFVVTSERLVIKRGLIAYKAVEVSLDTIEEVQITQSFLGRIFAYGEVKIRGTGNANIDVKMVWRPEMFRHEIRDARAAFTEAGATTDQNSAAA